MKKDKVAIVLKGYPRLSETFIAQEILGLQRHGLDYQIVSLRHPTDKKRHPVHDEITAPVSYLPEYLHHEPLRVLKAWWRARQLSGYSNAFGVWWQDLKRDFSRNRVRRFGQALVLAAELDDDFTHLYAHFLHTPASVTRYAAKMRQLPWSCSAHAKDIWTSPDWEKREKLADLAWLVTCTAFNVSHLKGLATDPERVELMYHGLDLSRFPKTPRAAYSRNGTGEEPVQIISVGRAVAKKGYDVLLQALALLPKELSWHLTHIGGGPLLDDLRRQAMELGLDQSITWQGAMDQKDVLAAYQNSDLFVLLSRVTEDGDRDGLPNVIVEAQSQGLPVVATNVSAIPELIRDGVNGWLVESEQPQEAAEALKAAITQPEQRTVRGQAGQERVHKELSFDATIGALVAKFKIEA